MGEAIRVLRHYPHGVMPGLRRALTRSLRIEASTVAADYLHFRMSWAVQKVVREIMMFLHTNGVATGRAARIYKTYDSSR